MAEAGLFTGELWLRTVISGPLRQGCLLNLLIINKMIC